MRGNGQRAKSEKQGSREARGQDDSGRTGQDGRQGSKEGVRTSNLFCR